MGLSFIILAFSQASAHAAAHPPHASSTSSASITGAPIITNLTQPTLTGTASVPNNQVTVKVLLASQLLYSATVATTASQWSVTVSPALPTNQTYLVAVYDSDATLLTTGSLTIPPALPAVQGGTINVPTAYGITSSDGNVSVGVSDRFGGAIAYYKDKRISDSTPAAGNTVNFTQAGALLQNALFLYPYDVTQEQMCAASAQVNGVCPGTLPFSNPTQGGYLADGLQGNPNGSQIIVAGNAIYTQSRMTNYNYDYIGVPLTSANSAQWQTNIWQQSYIYFDPGMPDVLVIDTQIAYCIDNNATCAGQPMPIAALGLPSFFALGSFTGFPSITGPYSRGAYATSSKSSITITSAGGETVVPADAENWVALLQGSKNSGVGLSVANYEPMTNSYGYSFSATPVPYMFASEPNLQLFETSNFSTVTQNGAQVYEFQPGGWFEFRTYLSTGTVQQIRTKLNAAESLNSTLPLHSF